jgi:uncharacterized protein Veg
MDLGLNGGRKKTKIQIGKIIRYALPLFSFRKSGYSAAR